MSLIIMLALFLALLFYTLGYYITHKYWYGDVIVAIAITFCLIAILITAFYA